MGVVELNLLKEFMKNRKNTKIVNNIIILEEKGDLITKDIKIRLEKAFLPNIRGNLSKAVELLDETLDNIKHASLLLELANKLYFEERINEILNITEEMYYYLKQIIDIFVEGGDINNPIREIKKREKDIDIIYFNKIYKNIINIEVKTFWEGKIISDFIGNIVKISDLIEDIADELQIIYLNV